MRSKQTKKLAFSAILSALAVVFLYLGALLDILDLSTATAASFCVAIVLCEIGTRWALLTYASAGLLALLVLPNRLGAVYFLCFLGFYPIAKKWIERKLSGIKALLVKLLLLNVCVLGVYALARVFLANVETGWFAWLLLGMVNVVFLVYDCAMAVLLRAYVFQWRKVLKIKF